MRLKTFVATYLLFLFILFSSVAFVSVYLTNSQINMLKDKSASQYQAIVHTLARDVAVTWGRNIWNQDEFSTAVSGLVRDYARYYGRHNIHLSITDLQVTGQDKNSVMEEIIFINQKDGHYIIVSGFLPEPFGYFLLDYRFDITGNIANSLLELATLRRYVPIMNEISISKLFNDISQTMEQSLREKGVQLICHNRVEWLYGQVDLIKSLLLNLCTNALKACCPQEGVIRLEAEEQPDGVIILVTDNGCGIPQKSLPRLTEPFYRVDKSRSREHGGTGLGMALCKQIVETHNTRMVVKSVLGEGTSVAVKFTTS